MLIKAIGCAIITLASGLLGMYYAYKPYFRRRNIAELIIAMEILENEINNFSALTDAFERIAVSTGKGAISDIFRQISNELKEKNGDALSEVWSRNIEKNKDRLYLIDEDFERLYSFGLILKSTDRDMEIRGIGLMRKYLDEKSEETNLIYLKNKRMYQSLGVLSGIMVSVALL